MLELLGSVLTGGIGGALLRLAPEVIGLFRGKSDNKHEYRMRQLDRDIAKDGGAQKLREIDMRGQADLANKDMLAYITTLKHQAQRTGIRWVDAWNSAIRPGITTAYMLMWGFVKLTMGVGLLAASLGAPETGSAILAGADAMWGPNDDMALSGLLSFWFVGRVFDKRK